MHACKKADNLFKTLLYSLMDILLTITFGSILLISLIVTINYNEYWLITFLKLSAKKYIVKILERVRFGDPDHDRALRTKTWSGSKTTWSS